MIKLFSKSENAEIFLNEDKILYVLPSIDVGSIIRLDNGSTISVSNDISYFNEFFFLNKIETPKTVIESTTAMALKDLPKTPNGNIDKRTNEYKSYMENIK